ncbi:hypothetical protein LSCM1_01433 [Leishmania martiniquensis]|uniref:PPM-type phosphatase domain-containing protein n=1 Tax=Leishmania martiniquensis TaxID=1580590 RepID=A0A836KCJ0_9TRYP|nr:hypothetical protein LSCM1_01433 [Leishmania martiniquensis]
MSSNTEAKNSDAGSATAGTSAASSPGVTGDHEPGSRLTLFSPLHTDATASSATPSPSVENTSDTAQAEPVSLAGRKRRLSFKNKQRQGAAAAGGASFEVRGMHSLPVHSPMSTAPLSSPLTVDLSPFRDRPLQQPLLTKSTAAASVPLTRCAATGPESPHGVDGAGAMHAPNQAPTTVTRSEAHKAAVTAEEGPKVPDPLVLGVGPSAPCSAITQIGSPHEPSAGPASASQPQSQPNAPSPGPTRKAGAAPPLRSAWPPEWHTTASSASADTAADKSAVGTTPHILRLAKSIGTDSAWAAPMPFDRRAMPEEPPTLSPVLSPSTSSSKVSFKDRQRTAAAVRKPIAGIGGAALASIPPRVVLTSSITPAPSETSVTTASSLPATATAPLTPHSTAAASPAGGDLGATPSAMQARSPSPSCILPSTSSQPPTSDRAAPAEPTALVCADSSQKKSTKGAGEPLATRLLPPVPLAKLAPTVAPRPASPLLAANPPTPHSHPRRGAQSVPSAAATEKPQFRFFAHGWEAASEGGWGSGARESGMVVEASRPRNGSCSADTTSASLTDADGGNRIHARNDEENLLACTEKEVFWHVCNPIGSASKERKMTSPPLLRSTRCSLAASREGVSAGAATSADRSETVHGGQDSSQTKSSMLAGEPQTTVATAACPPQPPRSCMRAHSESAETAPQSTGIRVASRRAPPEVPQRSSPTELRLSNIKFEQPSCSDAASSTGTLPAGTREQRTLPSSSMTSAWRQYERTHTSQRDTCATRFPASKHSSLAPVVGPDSTASVSNAQVSRAANSRRRHRDKMLAPEGTMAVTPRTSCAGALESSGVFPPSSMGFHQRSRTVDDVALMSAACGRHGGETPSSVTPELMPPSPGSTVARQSTFRAHFPSLPLQTAAAATFSALTASSDMCSSRDGPPIPLCSTQTVTLLPAETSGDSSATGSTEQSMNAGGVSVFSSGVSPLPARHQRTSSRASSLTKISVAMTSVLIPPAPSGEDLSAAAPAFNLDTPIDCRSIDDLSTYTMRRRLSVADSGANPLTGSGLVAVTANLDDAEDSDGDFPQRTVNSHYGGDSMMSTTTAELRKLRRRSNYSSLHYGTMTGYHHKRSTQRRGSEAASHHGWRRGGGGGGRRRRRRTDAESDSKEKESTVLFSQTDASVNDDAGNRSGKADIDDDDDDTLWEQKGSDEYGASNEEHDFLGETTAKQLRRCRGSRAKADAVAAATAAEDEEGDAAQRRTVGMWASVEHVFLPRYELVPDAASPMPLTLPASPNSNTNASSSTLKSDCDGRHRHCSLSCGALDKKRKATPSTTPCSDPQPRYASPTVDFSSTPVRAGSPYVGAANSSLMIPTLLTPKNSFSMCASGNTVGARPSGLVVLPDAHCSADAKASSSLSCSQFRRTPAQASGTTRLEPEDFTFGTVASAYNVDPADEEGYPQGSSDAKVAARLVFDAAAGVMLMDPEDEVGRYERHAHMLPDDQVSFTARHEHKEDEPKAKSGYDAGDDEANDGACRCDAAFIAKDFKGPDCSRYDANDLYDHCSRCHRRPAAFLCLHCLSAVCPSHVRRHHMQNPGQCTLFLNLLDIMNSFDRIFWCERCQQFTWKHTEVYDALVDQIAFTRGTYLKQPARDIHCVGYEVRLKDLTASTLERRAPAPVGSTATHACANFTHTMPPAAPLDRELSGLSLPLAAQLVASPPATEGFVASEASAAPASKLQPIPSASALSTGDAQLLMGADVGIFGLSPESPSSRSAQARLRPNPFFGSSPSQLPVRSPMQQFLSRDLLELSLGNTVTVGEPVTKLCALGASVQGWRTTQEDAEAVFLVDIPAITEEVVNRKELRAVAAAASRKAQEALDGGNGAHRDSSSTAYDNCNCSTSRTSENPPHFESTLRASDRGAHGGRPAATEEDAAAAAFEAAKEEVETTPRETIPMAVFCMFDGHGGDAVAKLAARHFEAHLRRAIEGTRPDDVRARALLFFLKAETDSAAATGASAPWLPPSVTAVPTRDGTFSYVAHGAAFMNTPASPATAATGAAPSSPASLDAASARMPLSHLSSPFQRASGVANMLASGDCFAVKLSDTHGDEAALLPKSTGTPPTLAGELRGASATGSLSVLVPITHESLRLHVAGGALGIAGASVRGAPLASESASAAVGSKFWHSPHTRADGFLTAHSHVSNSHFSDRNRRSGATLDAWEAVEEPLPEMISVAAGVASPRTGALKSRSVASAEDLRRGSCFSVSPSLAAGSVAVCPSPAAVVSIPEMEMLRQYFASIMEDALISLDDYLRSTPEGVRGDYNCVGCTACVVGITANFVLCANIGDSGAAFYTKDRMQVISVKHRVSDEEEQTRIRAAGYAVVNDRIEGMSAVPRALGDFDFKQCGGRGPKEQAVSAVPDVTIMPVPNDTDRWGIVLACDGVWDTATLHQVHVALTNTVNDLAVSGSAMDAVLRGAELYQHHLRGPVAAIGDSPQGSPPGSPPGAGRSLHNNRSSASDQKAPSPVKRDSFASKAGTEDSIISSYEDDDEGAVPRLSQVDAILLTAAAGVFAQCVAPEDNDEGIGLDNCSLIIVERRNVQE